MKVLGATTNHLDPLTETKLPNRKAQKVDTPLQGLYEVDTQIRTLDCDHEARQASARTDIDDARCRRE